MVDFPKPEIIETNGIKVALYEVTPEGEEKSVPVVFCHGFPELAYSWRHQLPAVAGAGFKAMAADGRGYGNSEAPEGISKYNMKELTADVIGLLDAKGKEKAVFVGHDWGALMTWSLPFYYPDRVAGLVGLNVPFQPHGSIDPLTLMIKKFGQDFYINHFQKPEEADNLFNADIGKSIRFFMRKKTENSPDISSLGESGFAFQKLIGRPEEEWPGEVFLSDNEYDYYRKGLEKNGFTGPINWYRNMVANWEEMGKLQDGIPKFDFPTLMILALNDPVLPPELANGMEFFFTDLEQHLVQKSGHWTQQEQPEEVNEVLLEWLSRKFPD